MSRSMPSLKNWTVAVGLQSFNALYCFSTRLIVAASTAMVLPCVLVFFFSQRIFTQGVAISGVKGQQPRFIYTARRKFNCLRRKLP
jgi:multiple sugar transport system permease protein